MATLVGSASMPPGGVGAAERGSAMLLVTMTVTGTDLAVATTLLIRLCTLWLGASVGLLAVGVLPRRRS